MSFQILKYDQKPVLFEHDQNRNLVSVYSAHIRYTYMGDPEYTLKYHLEGLYHALQTYGTKLGSSINVEGYSVAPHDEGQLLQQFTKLILEPILALAESEDVKERASKLLANDDISAFYETIESEFLLPYKKVNLNSSERIEQLKKPICYNLRVFISKNFNLSLPSWHKYEAENYHKFQQNIAHMSNQKPFIELLK
ncbi:MAG: hypothetical protein ACI9TY_001405 [Alphaproteobacteria bacterium]|jgi:hypothetical protein